jgi:hypothetical protein
VDDVGVLLEDLGADDVVDLPALEALDKVLACL